MAKAFYWTAIVLALAGPVSAQPANPFFPPPPPAIPQPPPTGVLVPYFGQVAPSQSRMAPSMDLQGPVVPYFGKATPGSYSPPAVAAPIPSVIPAGLGNPFFNDLPSVRTVSHVEPAQLPPGSYHPAGSLTELTSPGLGTESPDHPANKHPRLYNYRFGPDPDEPHFWVAAEYLMWHISGDRVMSPISATAQTTDLAALITDPRGNATQINALQGYGMGSGGRLSGGFWKEERCCVSWGMEWNAFILERRADGFTLASDANGVPPVLRPYIDSRTGQPALAIAAYPGAASGSLAINSGPFLWGTELNVVRRINEGDAIHWDLIAGLRYLDLDENLAIVQNTTLLSGIAGFGGQIVQPPNGLTITDAYDTRSQFFGGQFGSRLGCRYHRLVVDGYAKVAFGWSHLTSNASGSTTLVGPGPGSGQTLPGGILQVPSNSGRLVGDDFAVVPEMGITLGFDVTKRLRLTTGYSALYWSQVARPGGQVRWIVNPTQVPSSLSFGQPGSDPVPQGALARSGLWINGVTFGAMLKF